MAASAAATRARSSSSCCNGSGGSFRPWRRYGKLRLAAIHDTMITPAARKIARSRVGNAGPVVQRQRQREHTRERDVSRTPAREVAAIRRQLGTKGVFFFFFWRETKTTQH